MADDDLTRRKELTFEQAEGLAPLPSQLARDVLTKSLRARLFEVLLNEWEKSKYRHSLTDPWRTIMFDAHIRVDGLMPNVFEESVYLLSKKYAARFTSAAYGDVYGLMQWLLRHPRIPKDFATSVDRVLVEERAAYRVADNDTLMPAVTEEESVTIKRALAELGPEQFSGARSHLKSAVTALGSGNYADSVRDSIHAVESVARTIAPSAKLSEALSKLETATHIHNAMKVGFSALYGFTSDEKGIRHPLLDEGDAKVDEADAIFMIGACAAFVSYLISKARSGGLIA